MTLPLPGNNGWGEPGVSTLSGSITKAMSTNARVQVWESLNRSSGAESPSQRHRIEALRQRGYRGTTIRRHRAFQTVPLNVGRIIVSGILAAALTVAWLLVRPTIGRLWGLILQT